LLNIIANVDSVENSDRKYTKEDGVRTGRAEGRERERDRETERLTLR